MPQSYLGRLRQHVGRQKVISTGAVAVIRDERGRDVKISKGEALWQ